MKCQRCRKKYPDRFVEPMFANGGYIYLDPECVLKEMSEVHGYQFTEFTGTQAQQLLEDFREWKEKHD
jgi:hypothetical protein